MRCRHDRGGLGISCEIKPHNLVDTPQSHVSESRPGGTRFRSHKMWATQPVRKPAMDRMSEFRLIRGILIAFCLLGRRIALPQEAIEGKLTICSVGRNPEQYDNQVITVSARVQSDGMHGSQIYDESCAEFGIGLFIPEKLKAKGNLATALSRCPRRGTRGKVVFGTFTGIFQLKPGGYPPRILIVQRMQDITCTLEQPSAASSPCSG